jgi:hypothetical protein
MVIERAPVPPDFPLQWGVHKGVAIKAVPLTYLVWLRAQSWITDYPAIHAYLQTRKAELDTAAAAESPVANAAATFSSYEDYLKVRK